MIVLILSVASMISCAWFGFLMNMYIYISSRMGDLLGSPRIAPFFFLNKNFITYQ